MGNLVYVADTETVKEIFTGDPGVFRAGEANEVHGAGARAAVRCCCSTTRSTCTERRLLLPPFHGERVRRYRELVGEIAAARDRPLAARRPFALRPRMQTITLEVILRAVFGIREAERLDRLRTLLPKMLDHGTVVVWMPFLRRDLGRGARGGGSCACAAEVDELLLRRDPQAPRGGRPRRARRRPVDAARRRATRTASR